MFAATLRFSEKLQYRNTDIYTHTHTYTHMNGTDLGLTLV